jgi:hypothetical protein
MFTCWIKDARAGGGAMTSVELEEAEEREGEAMVVKVEEDADRFVNLDRSVTDTMKKLSTL